MTDDLACIGMDRRGRKILTVRRDLTMRNTLIVGQSGSGKSLFALGQIAESIVRDPAVCVTFMDGKTDSHVLMRDLVLPAYAVGFARPLGDVAMIEPWGAFPPPFNLCARMDGVTSDIQANMVVAAIEKFVGDEFGPRGRPLAIGTARATIELGGNLLTLASLLEDPGYREAAALRAQDPMVRHFLSEMLPRERADSIAAVLARVRGMLHLDRMRAILAASTSVRGAQLIRGAFVGIDAHSAPLGEERLATGFGSWVFRMVTNAIMARPPSASPTLVAIDEFQRLIGSEEEFLRLLEQCRSRNAALWLITQTIDNIPTKLRASIIANCRNIIAMSPNADTLHALGEYLPRPTGRRVDPVQGDRLQSIAAEREAIREEYGNLPGGHGVYVDVGNRRPMVAFRARRFPFRALEERAANASEQVRSGIARGTLGVPYAELLRYAHDPLRPDLEGLPHQDADSASLPNARGRGAARRKRRLDLEVE